MPRFAAPWGTLRVTTAAVLVLLGTVVAALAWIGACAGAPARVAGGVAILVGILSAVTVGATWALAPLAFAVEGGAIRIERPLRAIAIRSMRCDRQGSSRRARSGAPCGWAARAAASAISAGSGRGVSAPSACTPRAATISSGSTRPTRLRPLPGRAGPVPRRGARARLAREDGGGLASSGARDLPAYDAGAGRGDRGRPARRRSHPRGVRALAPVSARVTPDAVVVERRWAGRVEIPLATVRGAGVLSPAHLRGMRRVAGYSGSEVHYGRFRSDALGDFQLYAWRRGRRCCSRPRDDPSC